MAVHLSEHREGFGLGYTRVTAIGEADDDTGIEFGVLKLASGETHQETLTQESAFLLMEGQVEVASDGPSARFHRKSLFDEPPSALHLSAGKAVTFRAISDVELTVYRTENPAPFETEIYHPGDVRNELRGKGGLKDAAFRFVRTIFDDSNSHPNARLVLGEVINFPGRWSSYPPHHHRQPEIYHYRFTRQEGYGHAELGEAVLKIRNFDTVKILDAKDHSQCSAPGYGMYYSWVIRHLEEERYTVPEFTEAYRWTMEPGAQHWWPAGVDGDD